VKRLSRLEIILLGILNFNIISLTNTPARYLVLYPLGRGINTTYLVSRSTTTKIYLYIVLSKFSEGGSSLIKSIETTFYTPRGALLG
jgi:hypothetical protein